MDEPVYDYVMNHPESEDFYQHLLALIEPILPSYQKEGKSVLTMPWVVQVDNTVVWPLLNAWRRTYPRIGLLMKGIATKTEERKR